MHQLSLIPHSESRCEPDSVGRPAQHYPRKGDEGLGELCNHLFIQCVVLSTYCVQAPAKASYRDGYFIDLSAPSTVPCVVGALSGRGSQDQVKELVCSGSCPAHVATFGGTILRWWPESDSGTQDIPRICSRTEVASEQEGPRGSGLHSPLRKQTQAGWAAA